MAASKKVTVNAAEEAVKAEPAKTAKKVAAVQKAVEETVKAAQEKAKEAPKAAGRRRAAKSPAKKEIKTQVHVQFGGKSYSGEDLVKIAKDVWKYDQKAKDLTDVDLYVKPEENKAYYVFNGDITGNFDL